MFDVPLDQGAQIFIWGFCILMAFVNGLILINTLRTRRNHKNNSIIEKEARQGDEEKRKVIL